MQTESPTPAGNHEPAKGLPPVAPPSGRFIAQLFLIPGLIVAVGVLIYLGASYLVRSSHTPESFLEALDNPNPEIRWRGAHDLAQVLKRPESLMLASDPKFALDLAERLDRALQDLDQAEAAAKKESDALEQAAKARKEEVPQEQIDAIWRKLSGQRNHVLYLTSCLGDFTVPVGAPLLARIALNDKGAEIRALALRQRRAVWTLANLGGNYKRRYLGEQPGENEKTLSAADREAILSKLKEEAASYKPQRREWAQWTLLFLQNQGKFAQARLQDVAGLSPYALTQATLGQPMQIDAVLERCTRADDPYLRSLVALALNFWDGPRVEPALLRLTQDTGHGRRIEADID